MLFKLGSMLHPHESEINNTPQKFFTIGIKISGAFTSRWARIEARVARNRSILLFRHLCAYRLCICEIQEGKTKSCVLLGAGGV